MKNQPMNAGTNCISVLLFALAASIIAASQAFGGQGAVRMLYTVPNSGFVESPSGDNIVSISDTSGSLATLQTLINNARASNPGAIIVIHLMNGATYWVDNNSDDLVLGSQECLVGSGAVIEATNSAVTNSLVLISTGSTNVSVAGGTFNANGANIYGIYAPSSSARINIDNVTVLDCGQDCIQINGKGSSYFDNEMSITRCEVSGSSGHSGISIWNSTQTTCVDNYCHNNSVGIWLGNCGYANIANNLCESNSTGIDFNSGNDNYIANNTCNRNGTGILLNGSSTMVVSDLIGSNTVAGINSSGSGNIYCDNVFAAGNAANFINNGSGDDIVPYDGALNGSGQNYFYPPLITNQHASPIVNGMGRYDLTDNSTTTIDTVQSEYNAALNANPGDVIVLHLNGNYTVGANPLTLSSDTCVLLGGTIQINSSTSASCAVTASSGASYISISGGVIDGGTSSPPSKGRDAIYFSGVSMFQIDGMTLQNFGNNSSRVGGSDVIRIDHGNTPRIVTRCTINGGSARGIWLATSGPRDIVTDNTVTNVQMDGVDCDESTSASLVKFNYLYNNARYGVFLEQSASYNLILGNICNYDQSYDIGCYNNSTTYRSPTAYNSIICNSLLGDNGLRNGSTGTNTVTSSDNFFFDNTIMSANIQSQLYGAQNYYSQNYLGNSSLSTSGTEAFFNSADVSGNVYLLAGATGLNAVVTNASTSNGAAVILGPVNSLGSDQWLLIPTDSGYYRVINKNSGLALVVLGASTNAGAAVIQWTYNASGNDEWMPVPAGNGLYNFINRLSGLYLDLSAANAGAQLDQEPPDGGADQQFALIDATSSNVTPTGNTVAWTSGAAPDGNWQNPANWGGIVPQTNDWLSFGTGAQVETTNNLPAGAIFDNLAFVVSAPAFNLSGNGVTLANASEDTNGNVIGGAISDAALSNQVINLPVTLSTGSHSIGTAAGAGLLNLAGGLSRSTGALVQFNNSGGAIDSPLSDNTAGILGGWAVISKSGALVNNSGGPGTVDWAAVSGGAVTPYSGYTTVSGSGQTFANNASANLKVTSNGSSDDKISGNTTINTLNWVAATQNGYLDIPGSTTLTFGAQGGIIMNANKYLRIGNGQNGSAVTAGGAANTAGELSIYNLSYYSANAVEFWTTLADNGASGPMTVNSFGSVKIDNANSYSGGTYVNEGEFWCNGGGNTPFGSGPVYVFPGGRADLGGDNGATVTNNFYIAGTGFIPGGDPGAIKGLYNGKFTGLITLLGSAQIDPNAGSWTNTCAFSGGFAGTGNLTIGGPANVVAGTATFGGNCVYSGDTIIDATANANGGAGIFISSGKNNLLQNGGNLVLIGGSSGVATFDLNGTTQSINGLVATNGTVADALVRSSSPGGLLITGGNSADSIFGGVLANGNGSLSLTKTGTGTLTLNGNNTYTGGTTLAGGTLALSGAGSISNTAAISLAAGTTLDASGRPDQTVTLNNGQTLSGSGTVNVNLMAAPGATVMPGAATSLGVLSVASAAQFAGTTVMKLNASTGAGDQIQASSVVYGGTLTVTNLAGTLTAGQSFEVFQADSYAGAFSAITLPPLGAGLVWSNSLASSGTLQVVAVVKPQPQFNGVTLQDGNLILTGTNSVSGEQYLLLSSTNLALPLNQWTPVLTNTFGGGSFSLTNSISSGVPQAFYLLELP